MTVAAHFDKSTDVRKLFQKYARYTDKERLHHYGMIYEQWFEKLNGVLHILELGCNSNGGGCLLSFSERFPEAEIIGVDMTTEEIIPEVLRRKNVRIFQCDVYRRESVEKLQSGFSQSFDLIVDDCLHTPEDQVTAFEFWHPLLSENGLYVIEDVCELDRLSLMLAPWNREWSLYLGDTRNQGEYRYDSILIGLQRTR